MGQSWPLFVYFRSFLVTISIIQIEKSIDGVLGIRTRDTGWWAQTKPRSYGALPNITHCHFVFTDVVESNLIKLEGDQPYSDTSLKGGQPYSDISSYED